jgi:hypothetical protein
MKNKTDLLRIGILLLGISAIVFAGIALHWYYQIQTEKPWKSDIPPFWASCEETEKVIIIEVRHDLTNVSVKDKEGNIICSFNKIKAGSSEVCFVNGTGVFTVEYNDWKKVIVCKELKKLEISPEKVD